MKTFSYREAVTELESRGIMPDRAPSLEPTIEGLKRIGLGTEFSIDPKNVIVVAGTNGKGSTSATLEALLSSVGYRVGLYSSPHLIETTERIRISGSKGVDEISHEDFCKAHAFVAERTRDLKLTHFEMLTLMAVWYFASYAHVDKMILEVGLGGTWDSTNAVPHAISIITSLSLDHQNILGPTLNDIARNKFGIVSHGNLVVHAKLPPEVINLAHETRSRTQSRWVECKPYSFHSEQTETDPRFILNFENHSYELTLPGARGAQNTALALTAFQEMGHAGTQAALSKVNWPGRMEKFVYPNSAGKEISVYLSGDHNPQGMQSLLEILQHYPKCKWHVLFGIAKDKDLNETLTPLLDLAGIELYLTETTFKPLPLESYGDFLNKAVLADKTPRHVFQQILQKAQPGDRILVTGSLYLIGELRSFLLNKCA